MKQIIYLSTFQASPDATKRQQMLFATDVSYAISEGYDFIKSSDNMTFQIVDDNELIEVNITEEDLQTGYLNQLAQQDGDDCDDCDDDEDYCIACHNIMLIDGIINNTLSGKQDFTPDKVDTMLKLAHLKTYYTGVNHGL